MMKSFVRIAIRNKAEEVAEWGRRLSKFSASGSSGGV
jgi:hypothetical protein